MSATKRVEEGPVALGRPRHTTLHWTGPGVPPGPGDVLVPTYARGPRQGMGTGRRLLILQQRPVSRGTCTRCDGCTRWRCEAVSIAPGTEPNDAWLVPVVRNSRSRP